jgi:uncharacterized protein YlaI
MYNPTACLEHDTTYAVPPGKSQGSQYSPLYVPGPGEMAAASAAVTSGTRRPPADPTHAPRHDPRPPPPEARHMSAYPTGFTTWAHPPWPSYGGYTSHPHPAWGGDTASIPTHPPAPAPYYPYSYAHAYQMTYELSGAYALPPHGSVPASTAHPTTTAEAGAWSHAAAMLPMATYPGVDHFVVEGDTPSLAALAIAAASHETPPTSARALLSQKSVFASSGGPRPSVSLPENDLEPVKPLAESVLATASGVTGRDGKPVAVAHGHKPAEKPYKCQHCERSFGHKAHLARHVSCVHDDRPGYPCSFCPRMFVTTYDRECHLRAAHKPVRPFKCQHCSQRFAKKHQLQVHVERAHARTPVG